MKRSFPKSSLIAYSRLSDIWNGVNGKKQIGMVVGYQYHILDGTLYLSVLCENSIHRKGTNRIKNLQKPYTKL